MALELTRADMNRAIELQVELQDLGFDTSSISHGLTTAKLCDEVLRGRILDTARDLMAQFLYHDRKEDEDLPCGAIEEAMDSGIIDRDEIIAIFENELREAEESVCPQ